MADGTVVIDTKIDTEGVESSANDIEAALQRMANDLGSGSLDFGAKELVEVLQQAKNSLDGLDEKTQISIQKQIDSFAKLNNQYEQEKEKIEGMSRALQEFGEQQFETEAYQKLEQQLQALYDEYDRVEEKKNEFADLGFSAEDLEGAYAGVDRELEEIQEEMTRIIEKQEQMKENGSAYTQGFDTEKYAQDAQKLAQEEQKLEDMNNRLNTSFATIKNRIEEYRAKLSQTASAEEQTTNSSRRMGSALSTSSAQAERGTSGMSRFNSILQRVLASCKSLASHIPIVGKAISSMGSGGTGTIDKLTNSVSNLSGGFVRGLARVSAYAVGIRSLYSLMNKLTSAVKEGFTNLRSYSSTVDNALTSMTNSLGKVKNALATAFAPIVTAVAPYIEKFCNMIANALNWLGAFIAALTGQTTYMKAVSGSSSSSGTSSYSVQPMEASAEEEGGVQTLASGGSSSDTAGTISAMTSGVSTAADEMNKYAEAADNAASSISTFASATSDAETEVEDYISPLDELNRMQEKVVDSTEDLNDATSSSGSSGSGGSSGSDTSLADTVDQIGDDIDYISDAVSEDIADAISSPAFVETAISSDVAGWADKIKQMWADADFTELGNTLGEKLKNALDNINWDKIKQGASKVAKSLATFINGFVETEGLDESIGRTVAEAINTGMTFVVDFLDTMHWDSVGRFISGTLQAVLANIDWGLAGHMTSSIIIAAMDLIRGIVEGIDWHNLPQKIWESLKDFANGFDWTGVCKSAGELLGTLIRATIDLVVGIKDLILQIREGADGEALKKLKEWGQGCADAFFDGLIEGLGINEEDNPIAYNIIYCITHPFQTAKEIISTVVDSIVEFAKSIPSAILDFLGGLADTILGALQGVWDLVSSFFVDFWKVIIGDMSLSEMWEDLKGIGMDIWNGIAEGLLGAVKGLWDWLRNTLFQPIIDCVKGLFGIGSPATEMMPLGAEILNGLLEGLLGVMQNIGSWINENIFQPIVGFFSQGWETIKTGAGEAWDGITGVISTAWDGITTLASTVWDGISGFISGAWEGVTETASEVWDTVSGVLSTAWENISGWASEKWENIKTAVSGAWENLSENTSEVWDTVSTTLSDAWDTISGWASEKWGNIKESISGAWENVKEKTGNVWSDVKDTVSGVWDKITGKTSDSTSNVAATVSSKMAEVSSSSDASMNQMLGYVDEAFKAMDGCSEEEMASMAKTVLDNMRASGNYTDEEMKKAENYVKSAFTGIKSTTDTDTTTMASKVSSKFGEIRDKISGNMSDAEKDVGTAMSGTGKSMDSESSAMHKTISNQFSNIKNTMSNLMDSAKNSMENLGWSGLGGNIITGIQNGLNGNSGGLFNTMTTIAQNALQGAKNILGISSPSKRFRDEVGKMIPAGISVGLEKGFPATFKTLNNLTEGLFAGIPTLPSVTIPYLASGAVIPPNAAFAAVLGDQKNGTNLETPEALLRKIVREETQKNNNNNGGNNSYRFTAQINRRTLFDEVIAEGRIRQGVNGTNPFELA